MTVGKYQRLPLTASTFGYARHVVGDQHCFVVALCCVFVLSWDINLSYQELDEPVRSTNLRGVENGTLLRSIIRQQCCRKGRHILGAERDFHHRAGINRFMMTW